MRLAVETLAGEATPVTETFALGDTTYLEETVDVSTLAPGDYLARGTLRDASGAEVVRASSLFSVYPEQAWRDRIIPDSDVVPPPFTPLKAGKRM